MKLHLPKMFLAAVLVASVAPPAYAATGWGNNNGKPGEFYFIDTTVAQTIDTTGRTENSRFSIVADIADLEATASVKAKNGITLTVCQNPWPNSAYVFKLLELTNIEIADNGAIDLVVLDNAPVSINQVSGTLSSVNNAGSLNLGSAATTTSFGGTITNTGTMTVNGAVSITGLDGFTITHEEGVSWSDAENSQGYKTTSSKTYLLSSGGVSYTDATTLTYNGESIALTESDGNATFEVEGSVTGTVYYINNADTTINTGDETGATGFSVGAGATLNVNSAIGADGITVTGAGANINLTSGITLTHNGKVTINEGASINYTLDGATLDLSNTAITSGISSIDMKNGSVVQLHSSTNHLGGENARVAINMSGDSALSLSNGAGGTVWTDINVDGSGRILGSVYGNNTVVKGSIKGNGSLLLGRSDATWSNPWKIESRISDNESGKLSVTFDATDGAEGPSQVTLSGANTYSGGTTLVNGILVAASESALGTGKVTVNGGTLKQSTALSVSAMDYNSGTVNNNGQNLTVSGKLTAAVDMSIEGAGTTSIGSLDLSAGTTLTAAGSLTIGELVLDLSKYTDMAQTYTLVTTTGTDATVGLSTAYSTEYNGYTASVSGSGTNSLTLSFSEIVAPGGEITTTVLGQGGFADGMLTLNVDGNLTDATKVLISGISDGIMAEILGLSGLPEGGMVGITLAGTNDSSFTAKADQQIGFQGNDGVSYYFGEMVGSNWQYQVAYIPEPASATLGLAALMMLAARRRRKA